MVSSGIMLQLKKQSNWIQPNVEVTSSSKPVMLQSYLDAVSTVKEANISSWDCLLYTSPSPRDATLSRMPSSA